MDPISFSAAFLLSHEPITQPKLVESPSAVIQAPVGSVYDEPQAPPRPVRVVWPTDLPPESVKPPEGNQTPSAITEKRKEERRGDKQEEERRVAEQEKKKIDPVKTDLDQRHVRWLERSKNPVRVRLSLPKTAPAAWQLVDRFGTTWTHSDKTYLEQFVARRNITALVTAPCATYSGSCSNGRCAR